MLSNSAECISFQYDLLTDFDKNTTRACRLWRSGCSVIEVPEFQVAALTADGYRRGTNLFAELDDSILGRILFKHVE
jgi:hypothetical protein